MADIKSHSTDGMKTQRQKKAEAKKSWEKKKNREKKR